MKIKAEVKPFFGEKKYHRFRFSNGLQLVVIPNSVAPVFSYQTWFNVGSRDEEPGLSGLAHLFEHMMFKGTKGRPQGVFDQTMERSGARDLNAFTSMDYTAYVASLPLEKLALVAELEADRMVGLSLTKSQFESEREVVHNERKQTMENSPEGRLYEELQGLAFSKHPYGRPVIGFAEDLDRMTVKDCERFYSMHYAPNNALICVVGDLDPKFVASTIEKYYGSIPSSARKPYEPGTEPPQGGEKRKDLRLPVQVEKVYLGYRIPNGRHADQVALSVLGSLLSSGRSSRFYKSLVPTGFCIEQGAGSYSAKDPSLFYMNFTCQTGKTAQEVLGVVDKELDHLFEKGLRPGELERVKNKLQMETLLGLTSNPAMARFVGHHEATVGSVDHGLQEIEAMQSVQERNLMDVAKRYLRSANRSVLIGRPE
jgi:zinc protease